MLQMSPTQMVRNVTFLGDIFNASVIYYIIKNIKKLLFTSQGPKYLTGSFLFQKRPTSTSQVVSPLKVRTMSVLITSVFLVPSPMDRT